ncbi:hypothetical protein WDZ17_08010 [Pseudokineococcus basanitobsidens]|uniref:DUF3040 family protein n=1 Tax=Pseudokineococcus basanitobsidens TaxID=1926649 RepID=A0ABU8RJR9_9ACTN
MSAPEPVGDTAGIRGAGRYAGDSADDLTLGLVLLVLGAFLVGAAWAGPGARALLVIGVVLAGVGVVLLVRGVHRLATNLDRVLRSRLTVPADDEGSAPRPPGS